MSENDQGNGDGAVSKYPGRRRPSGPVQERKSRKTRQRVIRAAIECISESGFKHATTTRIAERAGISWGGIQHQFGAKAAILDAVLQELLGEFTAELAGISPARDSLNARVAALVHGAWALMCNPAYQAFREILRHRPEPAGFPMSSEEIMGRVNEAVDGVCAQLFGDLDLPPARIDLIKLFVFATLSGMAEQRRFTGLPEAATEQQLALLQRTVRGLIQRERR